MFLSTAQKTSGLMEVYAIDNSKLLSKITHFWIVVVFPRFDREDETAKSSSSLCRCVSYHIDEDYARYTARGACH